MNKKIYSLTAVIFLLSFFEAQSQCMLGISVSSPMALNPASPINGGGMGFEFLSGPINLIKPGRRTLPAGYEMPAPLAIRFGGHAYLNGAGHKTYEDIPLLSPGTGNATAAFQNMLCTSNFTARISSSLAGGYIIPYVEGFAGLRYFSSDLTITPNDHNQKSSSRNLGNISGLATGGSAGLMFRLGNNDCFLDAGAQWSHSGITGEYVDIHSLQRIGNSIGYKTLRLPNDFVMFRVGFTGYIDNIDWRGRGDGSFWEALIDGLFDGCGHGGGSAAIGLIKF